MEKKKVILWFEQEDRFAYPHFKKLLNAAGYEVVKFSKLYRSFLDWLFVRKTYPQAVAVIIDPLHFLPEAELITPRFGVDYFDIDEAVKFIREVLQCQAPIILYSMMKNYSEEVLKKYNIAGTINRVITPVEFLDEMEKIFDPIEYVK